MSSVLKMTFNNRFDNNSNTSISFEHIVSDEEDAKQCGEEDARLMKAYLIGFANVNLD